MGLASHSRTVARLPKTHSRMAARLSNTIRDWLPNTICEWLLGSPKPFGNSWSEPKNVCKHGYSAPTTIRDRLLSYSAPQTIHQWSLSSRKHSRMVARLRKNIREWWLGFQKPIRERLLGFHKPFGNAYPAPQNHSRMVARLLNTIFNWLLGSQKHTRMVTQLPTTHSARQKRCTNGYLAPPKHARMATQRVLTIKHQPRILQLAQTPAQSGSDKVAHAGIGLVNNNPSLEPQTAERSIQGKRGRGAGHPDMPVTWNILGHLGTSRKHARSLVFMDLN